MKKIVIDQSIQLPKTAVVLGNFDGIHKGHMLLINKAKEIAREEGVKTAVFTFEPHPTYVLANRVPVDLIYTSREKEKVMEDEGLDFYVELVFTKETANMSPAQFIEEIILEKMNAQVVIIGADYRFGKNREGDYATLVEYSKDHDFDVHVIHKLKYDHTEISSTWIREEIKKGNVAFANTLMGRPFFFVGQVMHGKQIGKTIGFPTANLIPDPSKLLPPKGVYVSTVEIDGKTYPAVTNVGLNPTVAGAFVTVEAHILNFDENIYDKVISVILHQFLRPELRFDNLDALKDQIAIDLKMVQDIIKIG